MGRGGKRPGAGAPKGNMNALKHGLYSKQLAKLIRVVIAEPKLSHAVEQIKRRLGDQRQMDKEAAAFTLYRIVRMAQGNGLNLNAPAFDLDAINEAATNHARRQIRKAVRKATKKLSHTASIKPQAQPPDLNQNPDRKIP